MNTDDILDRLFAAVGKPVEHQLLADAHSAIYWLNARVEKLTRALEERSDTAAELTWTLRDERDERAAEVARLTATHEREQQRARTAYRAELTAQRTRLDRLANQLVAEKAAHAADVDRARRERRTHDDEYRRIVGRLPAEIRRRRAAANQPAPSLVDTQLLLGVLKAIDQANRVYDETATPTLAVAGQQRPEGMTA